WAALRSIYGGALDLRQSDGAPGPIKAGPFVGEHDWQNGPDRDRQNVILCAGRKQVANILSDWSNFTTEEQLRRVEPNSGPIFVTQQPDNGYRNEKLAAAGLDYPAEAHATNSILMAYGEDAGFAAGYAAGVDVLAVAKAAATRAAQLVAKEAGDAAAARADAAIAAGADPVVARAQAQAVADAAAAAARRPTFKMELRRQYLLPALGGLCRRWYGLPDDRHMLAQGWGWEEIVAAGDAERASGDDSLTRTHAHCPGDFLSPSRNAFYPRPGKQVEAFAQSHGRAILDAATAFVTENRAAGGPQQGSVARAMFGAIADDEVLARNLIGTMVGAIPPMDGNLRGILAEWLGEKSLWRHQAALRAALRGQAASTDFAAARAVLYGPVSQAMCKRPAPDLLYRTATGKAAIEVGNDAKQRHGAVDVETCEGDLIVVSLVSASQRSLKAADTGGMGDVGIVFGGRRRAADQGYQMVDGSAVPDPQPDIYAPVHACPAQDMAMGAIMGIMAALLDAGTIQAQPASLIVRFSDW
ncbi:MAG: hypothetical protein RLZZ58_2045, partial [Pseudomonadota bacterium]